MSISVKYWLLAMVRDEALVRLMPFRFWRKVSWMLRSPTFLRPVVQPRTWRPGPRTWKFKLPTLVRLGKVSAPTVVRPVIVSAPSMLERVVDVTEDKLLAPLAINEPVIVWIPLKSREPVVPVATEMEPEKVGQAVASAMASPPFCTVAVA